ncbi:peroxide stress protein YaaA [Marinomonas atlantica]|uniref:peroxide stress protein YaaA n=1 Tax=Marinomonas atlantica TaxID=1806668 RepID=UPI000834DB14|nr:peroxide stress protein YaaA [Marinomonas atlantica]
MKYLISPAKTLDLDSKTPDIKYSEPRFLDQAQSLINTIKPYTPADIASLMKLSDKLATLNVERYQTWSQQHNANNSRPALFTFMGDVYTGLDAYSLSTEQIHYAQSHLRILSGLYGLLKPLDFMQPYRLEMGTKLKNSEGDNLYHFWGSQIANALTEELEKDELLVNLASNEYFKAVDKKAIKQTIITPNFLDEKNGQYKVISFYAKKARGLMVRYLIESGAETIEDIKRFDLAGYRYDAARSKPLEPVFTRAEGVTD